ncbi:MAG TPA: RNA 3'-terminal phosphate cyclase [Thermoplasmata archaeon]|nr:RNA 3'-terminal phosphate cyclase [Thermoplasmata archaeon]
MRMIQIDGSYGEGGGQILRTSVSLSAVTGEPVKISKIRVNRPNPGLSPQHVTGIEAVAEICGADVDGLFAGSKEVVFRPGRLIGGEYEFDVGTAGSISLVMQSCLLPSVMSKSRVRMSIKGGTDVRWSPPIDFFRMVHLPLLARFGGACDLELISRGFYPEGGGETVVEISPAGGFKPVDLSHRGKVLSIQGVAYAQNLPEHVVSRMKHSALKKLLDFNKVAVESDLRRGHSTGAGIVLVAECENTVIGESALGAKGVKSETLGENCADDLLETIKSEATVDDHMLDQILPYMALAGRGSRVLAEEMTGHAETNIWVIEQLLGKKFAVTRNEKLVEVTTI